MENYIVRIYRRDEANPKNLAGVFESVENETRNTFTSLDSLMDLLVPRRDNHTAAGDSLEHEVVHPPLSATHSN